jgi:hypothetical protein
MISRCLCGVSFLSFIFIGWDLHIVVSIFFWNPHGEQLLQSCQVSLEFGHILLYLLKVSTLVIVLSFWLLSKSSFKLYIFNCSYTCQKREIDHADCMDASCRLINVHKSSLAYFLLVLPILPQHGFVDRNFVELLQVMTLKLVSFLLQQVVDFTYLPTFKFSFWALLPVHSDSHFIVSPFFLFIHLSFASTLLRSSSGKLHTTFSWSDRFHNLFQGGQT